MKRVLLLDTKGTGGPCVQLLCNCGWGDMRISERNARRCAEDHIRYRHGEGRVVYGTKEYFVEAEEFVD